MTFNRALEMLAVLGYEVTVQPMKTEPGPRIKGQYVIVARDVKKKGGDKE